jgi:hypothetical protein
MVLDTDGRTIAKSATETRLEGEWSAFDTNVEYRANISVDASDTPRYCMQMRVKTASGGWQPVNNQKIDAMTFHDKAIAIQEFAKLVYDEQLQSTTNTNKDVREICVLLINEQNETIAKSSWDCKS